MHWKLTRTSREHPEAKEVFVTGTFDDWGKTEKLDRKGDFFEKDVQLPNKDKILYKVRQARVPLMPVIARSQLGACCKTDNGESFDSAYRAPRRVDTTSNHDAPFKSCVPRATGKLYNILVACMNLTNQSRAIVRRRRKLDRQLPPPTRDRRAQ